MIYFECYGDETLLKAIGFVAKDLSGGHSFGRSRVTSKLEKTKNSLGLIDEDPGAARDPYLKYLSSLKPSYSDKNIQIIHDKVRDNKVVVIRPSLEPWIVKIANECNLDLGKYALSTRPDELYEELTAKGNLRAREKLTEFINDASKHSAIVKLKSLKKK